MKLRRATIFYDFRRGLSRLRIAQLTSTFANKPALRKPPIHGLRLLTGKNREDCSKSASKNIAAVLWDAI